MFENIDNVSLKPPIPKIKTKTRKRLKKVGKFNLDLSTLPSTLPSILTSKPLHPPPLSG